MRGPFVDGVECVVIHSSRELFMEVQKLAVRFPQRHLEPVRTMGHGPAFMSHTRLRRSRVHENSTQLRTFRTELVQRARGG